MSYSRRRLRRAKAPVPWGFSEAPGADDPGVPNEPTVEGRRLGYFLAKLTDRAYEEREGQTTRLRCRGCALRLGTLANGCEEPLLDIAKAVIEERPFYCHMGKQSVCAGVEVLTGSEAAKVLDRAVRRAINSARPRE